MKITSSALSLYRVIRKLLCAAMRKSISIYCYWNSKHFVKMFVYEKRFLEVCAGYSCNPSHTPVVKALWSSFFILKILIPTPFYSKKRKFSRNDHSLSFVVALCHLLSLVVTCCHLLSLVLPLIAIRCTTRCHLYLLSVVEVSCHVLALVLTRFQSLSLDVSLVCLFIKDHTEQCI